jgi:AcrR family transcriptional regulator
MRSSASTAAPSTPKRDLLLDTANRLFYRDGYHAVGIDTILREAGLAKMTLYHHFASKEELIVAALERRGELLAESMQAAMEQAGSSPRKRLLALFEWHREWFSSRDFNGCAFIRAAGEYTELSSPIHRVVAKQKERSRAAVQQIVEAMGIPDAAAVGAQIHLLLQGAIVNAHVFGDATVIDSARDAALKLLK